MFDFISTAEGMLKNAEGALRDKSIEIADDVEALAQSKARDIRRGIIELAFVLASSVLGFGLLLRVIFLWLESVMPAQGAMLLMAFVSLCGAIVMSCYWRAREKA